MISKIKNYFNIKDTGSKETEFLPAALEVVETPPSPGGRIVLWTLFSLIIVTVLWSIFGKVDEVAIAPGKLIPTGFVKVVQAESKGIVKSINVKDGQQVTQGQLLLELDQTISGADLARIKKDVAYYILVTERLKAEQDELPFTPSKAEFVDPQNLEYEQRLYASRLVAYQTRLSATQAAIRQNKATINSAQANEEKLRSLLEIARDKEQRMEKLVAENAVSMFTLLDHRARRVDYEQSLAAQIADTSRTEAALAQSMESLANIKAERLRDISTQLVEARKQLASFQEELKKAEEKNRLAKIVAPTTGRVHQLAIHTVGGIVTDAQPLMMIVPNDIKLEVEATVANKDIGFIYPGQTAEVKIETFSFQKYGTIDAVVTEVSPDAIDDKERGRVYRLLLKLNKETVLVGGQQVQLSPGMTATAEIKIREKRIIEFFLDPFRQYQNEALRER